MELGKKICDDSNSSFGEDHEIYYDTYSLSDDLKQNTIDNKYIYGSLEKPMAQKILLGVTRLFIYHRMGERGWLLRAKGRLPERKKFLQMKLGCLFW